MSSSLQQSMADDWHQRAIRQQNQLQSLCCQWREFTVQDGLMKTMVSAVLFGIDADVSDDIPQLNDYYQRYDSKKWKKIDMVYNQIRKVFFNVGSPRIHLGVTLLVLKTNGQTDDDILYFIFRTRDPNSRENVHFIDPGGRVYVSWQDFFKTNKLPKCKYLTVKDGIYNDPNNIIFQTYKSPAANNSTLTTIRDFGVLLTSITTATAGFFAVAPAAVAIAGPAVGIYCLKQCVDTLSDRYKHRQSIGLNNRESVTSYLCMSASVLTGVNSVAIANINKIKSISGWATNAIMAANYLTLAIDGTLLLMNVTEFYESFQNGTLSSQDILHLSLNVFLLYGAVMNVRQLRTVLTDQSMSTAGSTTNKKLTKTQKRNLQRKRAKARNRQAVIASDTIVVSTESDYHTNVQATINLCMRMSPKLLFKLHPRSEVVYEAFLDIKELLENYRNNRIKFESFALQLYQHAVNLYEILKTDIQTVLDYCQQSSSDVPQNEDVAQLINNEFDQIDQDIGDIFEPDEPNNLDSVAVTDTIHCSYYYWIMTCTVEKAVNQKNIESSSDVVIMFQKCLRLVTDELMKEFVHKYDLIVATNEKHLGLERAKKMASIVGEKTSNEFYANAEKFSNYISEMTKRDSVEQTNVNKKVVTMVRNIRNLIDKSFSIVSPEDEGIGLEKTIKILLIISEMVTQQLSVYLEEIKNEVKLVFELNIEYFDVETVKNMLQNIDLTMDDAEQFEKAEEKIVKNMPEFAIKLLERCAICMESSSTESSTELKNSSTNSTHSDKTNTDVSNTQIFISYCSQFYVKISTIDDTIKNNIELFKKVIHFMGKKFLEELSFYKNQWRTINEELVGPQDFKEMMKNFDLTENEISIMLDDIGQKLLNDSDLMIGQYLSYYENNSLDLNHCKIWYATIHNEGFTTYLTTCKRNQTKDYYIVRASYLFKVPITDDAEMEKNENCLVLKIEKYMITFNFYDNDSEGHDDESNVLMILLDLSNIDENDTYTERID